MDIFTQPVTSYINSSELKDNVMETPTYSKCEDYASQSPAARKIELKNHLKKVVSKMLNENC